jgi:nicotinate-nucleotide adenylyltransferase
MRIGIYAGTFDPVHEGHLTFADAALRECGLDTVVFLPERLPRHKKQVTSFFHRLAMLQLAVADHPQFVVKELEGSHFSVDDTLPILQGTYKGDELYLLVGSDVARHMVFWPHCKVLFGAMELVVGMRQDDIRPDLPVRARFIETQHKHVAASHIRKGQSTATTPAIGQYIDAHHLYGVQ